MDGTTLIDLILLYIQGLNMIFFLRFVVLAIGIGMIYSSFKYMLKNKKADFTMFFSGLFVLFLAFIF